MSSRTLRILRHEFLYTIKKKSFVILTLAVPIVVLLAIGVFRLASTAVGPSTSVTRVGYVDQIGGFDPLYEDATVRLIRMESEDDATEALTSGELDEYFVIPADYVATGTVARYTLEKELAPPPAVAYADG